MITHRVIASIVALNIGLVAIHSIAAGQALSDSVLVKRITPRWSTGSLNLQFGTAHLGLTELNESLTASNRPAFSTNAHTIGLSGYARFGRLLLGAGGEAALPQRTLSTGWIAKVAFRSAMLDAGIALVDRPRVLVYSQASLGIRMTSLRLQQSGDFTYDAGVQEPARGVALSSRNVLTGFGLVAESRWNSRLTGAFSIGVRAGVVQPWGTPTTSAGESAVSGTPRESTGRYLRLSVGKPLGSRRQVMSALSTALLSLISG